jgi:hypothetical protein
VTDRPPPAGAFAIIIVGGLAIPGLYYFVYLQLAYVLAFMGMHMRDLPAYYYTGGFFDVAGPIAWLATPLALIMLAVCWTRLGTGRRWLGAILCGLATAGALLSFLQLSMFGMRI